MPSPYTHVIWDFNGTVLDDIDLGIQSVNLMLAKRGLPVIPSREHYRSVMRFPIIEYYRSLGFDFEKEDYYTVLAPEWVALYKQGEATCAMMPQVLETLEAVKAMGIPQILLSASDRELLLYQLGRLGIQDYFEEVLGLDNIYAKSKTGLAQAWLDKHPGARPLCVGDTDHDAALADTLGADCLLYVGGHQSEDRLRPCEKPMIRRMDELLTYLKAGE